MCFLLPEQYGTIYTNTQSDRERERETERTTDRHTYRESQGQRHTERDRETETEILKAFMAEFQVNGGTEKIFHQYSLQGGS